jgi:hypothetical protein
MPYLINDLGDIVHIEDRLWDHALKNTNFKEYKPVLPPIEQKATVEEVKPITPVDQPVKEFNKLEKLKSETTRTVRKRKAKK